VAAWPAAAVAATPVSERETLASGVPCDIAEPRERSVWTGAGVDATVGAMRVVRLLVAAPMPAAVSTGADGVGVRDGVGAGFAARGAGAVAGVGSLGTGGATCAAAWSTWSIVVGAASVVWPTLSPIEPAAIAGALPRSVSTSAVKIARAVRERIRE
jgi:hypothetical protein